MAIQIAGFTPHRRMNFRCPQCDIFLTPKIEPLFRVRGLHHWQCQECGWVELSHQAKEVVMIAKRVRITGERDYEGMLRNILREGCDTIVI